MRRIEVNTWKTKDREGKDLDENILIALNVLLGNKKPEEIPKGLDKFRLFGRLARAFDNAEDKGVLELEESDYGFLREIVEKDVPSLWGMNDNLSKAIEDFLGAKQE